MIISSEDQKATVSALQASRARLGKATVALAEARSEYERAVNQHEVAIARARSHNIDPKDVK